MKFNINYSNLGKIVRFFYQPPSLKVKFTLDNGKQYDAIAKYRIENKDEFYLQWKEYLQCVIDNRQPYFNFRSSIIGAILVESIERSALMGESVLISDLRKEYKI